MINAIIYFANRTRNLGKIKLFKLLYLLDFEHFRQTGRSVTGLEYYAWKLGPVPVALGQEWEEPEPDMAQAVAIEPEKVIDYVRERVIARAEFDDSHFSKRELRIMADLVEQYRDELSHRMIDVTHAENGAWARVWNNGRGLNRPIDYELSLAENDPHRAAILEFAREHQALVQTAHVAGARLRGEALRDDAEDTPPLTKAQVSVIHENESKHKGRVLSTLLK